MVRVKSIDKAQNNKATKSTLTVSAVVKKVNEMSSSNLKKVSRISDAEISKVSAP